MWIYLARIICAIKIGFEKLWHIQAFEGHPQLLLSYPFVGTGPCFWGFYLSGLACHTCLHMPEQFDKLSNWPYHQTR